MKNRSSKAGHNGQAHTKVKKHSFTMITDHTRAQYSQLTNYGSRTHELSCHLIQQGPC